MIAKRSWCLSVLVLLLFMQANAQNCNEATVAAMAGKWTEGMKGSTAGTAAADLAREKITVGNIHAMLQQSYKPLGADADYNGAYFRTDEYQPANLFSYNLRVMPYICSGNKITRAHESNTSMVVAANQITFGPEIYQPFTDASAWDVGFRSMRIMPIAKDGGYYWEEPASLGFGMTGVQYTWLITYDGKLPFSLITKKEFLERKKQKLLAGKSEGIKGIDEAIAKVDEMLKRPAAELNETAIVKQDTHNFLLHLFTTADDPFAAILIRPNPGYFNKNLPRSSPQFFSVVITGNHKNQVMARAMKDMQQAIDRSKLKSLLGK